jgi:biopolymer transport protein ExbB/TolQ
MRAHGNYSSRNVADCMAALLLISWEIMMDETASDAQVRGAHGQVRGIFLNTPRLQQMTNAERQEMAEKSAYQVMIANAAREQYLKQPDPDRLKELQASASTVMQQQGIDLSQLKLTAQGFHKS